jgi:hypothetical protein
MTPLVANDINLPSGYSHLEGIKDPAVDKISTECPAHLQGLASCDVLGHRVAHRAYYSLFDFSSSLCTE